MDAFASIALATNPSGHHRPSTLNDGCIDIDRPSKRAKSEKPPPSDWSRTMRGANTRPVTSDEQSPESRRLEAELLLNFALEAARLVNSPRESPQINTQLSFNVSRPSSSVQVGLSAQSPESRGRGLTKARCWDAAGEGKKAEEQTHLHEERVIYKKRPKSETSPRQEPDLDQRLSGDPAGEPHPTTVDHPEIEGEHLQHAAIIQQWDMDIPPEASEKEAGNRRLETSNSSEVGEFSRSSGDIMLHDPQNDMEIDPQSNGSGADVKGESYNNVSSDERSISNDLVQEPASQPREGVLQALEDAAQASDGREGVNRAISKGLKIADALEEHQEKVDDGASRLTHHSLGNQGGATDGTLAAQAEVRNQSTSEVHAIPISILEGQPRPAFATAAICASCRFGRNSPAIENDNDATSWISCDGCKAWFHFACAGFKTDREVRSVDKYRCRKCKPLYGATTYVRKSSRAHSAIDYAGLHQGVIKTSDERPEHHYIKPIKDGTITFLPENFARMRPELVTTEYFEKGTGMKEPIVIPASFNPRPKATGTSDVTATSQADYAPFLNPLDDNQVAEDWFSRHMEPEAVSDQGQDALDMVIPKGLTVRRVAELYGLDEKVEVIDVKSQNGENKKWNMRRWADYYENANNKVVRNVISLEISQSKLGRLIRRPRIVRDLDLQDSVWPEELLAKGEYPRVQFYCLMSVADCFTDFHIDFGGSSVFYHILKGKKTFLFIPPKEKHLKKYEEWCMSPAQNWTFLGGQTKECYRVDLSEGDTMLIPAGWIHAVWTPEDSLVIGGNFLTRLDFGMQLRVAQVEKATGVARKFRYPHFQKLHWYTALCYLEDDPLPRNVKELLHAGGTFVRQQPAYDEFDSWGENSRPGVENYHTRYYSQSELDGLPDLTRYLLRTALIDIGSITDGISTETRNAVKKSIPRGHGEPLDVLKTFAAWCAWKRGNEPIPHWAYPDAEPEMLVPDKLSASAMKRLDQAAALQAPRRQSARMHSQQAAADRPPDWPGSATTSIARGQYNETRIGTLKKPRASLGNTRGLSHRKTACDTCRKRRRACKHKDQVAISSPAAQLDVSGNAVTDLDTASRNPISLFRAGPNDAQDSTLLTNDGHLSLVRESSSTTHFADGFSYRAGDLPSQSNFSADKSVSTFTKVEEPVPATIETGLDSVSGNFMLVRPRHKACTECRKSKVSTVPAIPYFDITNAYHSVVVYTMNMAMRIPSRSGSLPSRGLMHGSRTLSLKKLLCQISICRNLSLKAIPMSNNQWGLYQYSKSN